MVTATWKNDLTAVAFVSVLQIQNDHYPLEVWLISINKKDGTTDGSLCSLTAKNFAYSLYDTIKYHITFRGGNKIQILNNICSFTIYLQEKLVYQALI